MNNNTTILVKVKVKIDQLTEREKIVKREVQKTSEKRVMIFDCYLNTHIDSYNYTRLTSCHVTTVQNHMTCCTKVT